MIILILYYKCSAYEVWFAVNTVITLVGFSDCFVQTLINFIIRYICLTIVGCIGQPSCLCLESCNAAH